MLLCGSSVKLTVIGRDDRVVLDSCCANTIYFLCLQNLSLETVLLSSLLFFCSVAFIFRWSVAVLAQHMLICEDNDSIYTHIKLWAEVQIQAFRLGERQQCFFLSAAESDMLMRVGEDFML